MTKRKQQIAISMASIAAAAQSVGAGLQSGSPLEVRADISAFSDIAKGAVASSQAQALTRANMGLFDRGIHLDAALLETGYLEVASGAEPGTEEGEGDATDSEETTGGEEESGPDASDRMPFNSYLEYSTYCTAQHQEGSPGAECIREDSNSNGAPGMPSYEEACNRGYIAGSACPWEDEDSGNAGGGADLAASEHLQDSTNGPAYLNCYSNCHWACHGSRGWR